MNIQQKMKATLAQCGIPYKQIDCYGSQIVITSLCENTANKWASILGTFATVRGITHSVDYAKVNKNTCLKPTTIEVWRTFARV